MPVNFSIFNNLGKLLWLLQYSYSLRYKEEPDYKYIQDTLEKMFTNASASEE